MLQNVNNKITKIIQKIDIKNIIKLIILYIILLILFYKIRDNSRRLFYLTLLYILVVISFNINYKLGLIYFLLGICCAVTEHIFIKYFDLTWNYRKTDLETIPFWLISLWSIAIIMITESSNNIISLISSCE